MKNERIKECCQSLIDNYYDRLSESEFFLCQRLILRKRINPNEIMEILNILKRIWDEDLTSGRYVVVIVNESYSNIMHNFVMEAKLISVKNPRVNEIVKNGYICKFDSSAIIGAIDRETKETSTAKAKYSLKMIDGSLRINYFGSSKLYTPAEVSEDYENDLILATNFIQIKEPPLVLKRQK